MGMLLLLLILVFLVPLGIKYFGGMPRLPASSRSDAAKALAILEERYARGEMDREEFLQKRADLLHE